MNMYTKSTVSTVKINHEQCITSCRTIDDAYLFMRERHYALIEPATTTIKFGDRVQLPPVLKTITNDLFYFSPMLLVFFLENQEEKSFIAWECEIEADKILLARYLCCCDVCRPTSWTTSLMLFTRFGRNEAAKKSFSGCLDSEPWTGFYGRDTMRRLVRKRLFEHVRWIRAQPIKEHSFSP